jgi:hypothetical protein
MADTMSGGRQLSDVLRRQLLTALEEQGPALLDKGVTTFTAWLSNRQDIRRQEQEREVADQREVLAELRQFMAELVQTVGVWRVQALRLQAEAGHLQLAAVPEWRELLLATSARMEALRVRINDKALREQIWKLNSALAGIGTVGSEQEFAQALYGLYTAIQQTNELLSRRP